MSTRSNIAIKVKSEDLNKKLFLKIDGKDTKYSVVATEENPYLEIYCHHDGYLSHMGELLNKHTNYDEILNIILHGDTSSLDENCGNLTSCAYAVNEGFEDYNSPKTVNRPENHQGYLYWFEDNKWYVDCYKHEDELLSTALQNYED